MAATNQTHSVFYSIPVEILNIIVGYCIVDDGSNSKTSIPVDTADYLLSIRLASCQFAYVEFILQRLFYKVTCAPGQTSAMERVGRYVQHITFKPAVIKSNDYENKSFNLDCETLATPLAAALKHMPNAKSVSIVDVKPDWRRNCYPKKGGIFSVAVRTLAGAAVNPQRLTIGTKEALIQHHDDLSSKRFQQAPDLSNLQALKYYCREAGSSTAFTDVLIGLLTKCSSNLRRLSVSFVTFWPPGIDPPPMPALHHLSLLSPLVDPPSLSDWILKSPLLRTLSLREPIASTLHEHTLYPRSRTTLQYWRPIFDCLRMNPTKLYFSVVITHIDRLRDLYGWRNRDSDYGFFEDEASDELHIDRFFTGAASKRAYSRGNDVVHDAERALENYIAGIGRWEDHGLEEW